MPLTDTTIRNLKPRRRIYGVADGGGLFIEVSPSGTKSWRMRYRWGGRQPKVSFGQYPAISLAVARGKREEVKTAIERDQDPAHVLRAKKKALSPEERALNTFEGFARRWHSDQVEGKVSTARNTIRALEKDVFPLFGSKALADVTIEDVIAVTDRIKKRGKHQMALVTRNIIKRVFDHAIGRGRLRFNPAAAVPAKMIASPQSRDRVLRPKEIGKVLVALDKSSMHRRYKLAVYLLMLTLVRKTELLHAKWDDVDLEKKTLVIPATRMKMKRDHVVYLSDQAVLALEELKGLAGDSEYLFPSGRGRHDRPICKSTVNHVMKDLQTGVEHFVLHDFRRTGSTLLHEKGHPSDVIEKLLAHEVKGVRGTYNRAEYADKRAEILQEWADFVDAQRDSAPKVVLGSFGKKSREAV